MAIKSPILQPTHHSGVTYETSVIYPKYSNVTDGKRKDRLYFITKYVSLQPFHHPVLTTVFATILFHGIVSYMFLKDKV